MKSLIFLAKKSNQVIAKDQIFRTIWKSINVTDDSLVQCIADIVTEQTNQAPIELLMPVAIPAERPSIAVMGFRNIGSDHTGDVIATGLSTDIHFNLAKMSRLFVDSSLRLLRVACNICYRKK